MEVMGSFGLLQELSGGAVGSQPGSVRAKQVVSSRDTRQAATGGTLRVLGFYESLERLL